MITCTMFREQISSALYRELNGDELEQFEAHRQSCRGCASLFAGMAATVSLMNRLRREEPEDAYWAGYSARVMDKIEKLRAKENFNLLKLPARLPSWAYGIAALLLLIVGIYLGKSFFGPGTSPVSPAGDAYGPATAGMPDSITAMVAAYLDRSRNVLLGVVNSDAATYSPALLETQQRASRELLNRGVFLKAALNRPDQQQVRQLIQSLEVILLQLANIEVEPGVPMVELVRDGINKNSILLKINMEELKTKAETARQTKKSDKHHS